MNLENAPAIIPSSVLEGGYCFAGTDIGVGAILAVNAADKMLFIQKASREKYEFSDLWAFPGGMLRMKGSVPAVPSESDFCEFLEERVLKETGIKIPASSMKALAIIPPTTSYTTKEIKRWTAVFVYTADIDSSFAPAPNDKSIQAAKWASPFEMLVECTPVSRLAIAHVKSSSWSAEMRLQAKKSIAEALEFCRTAANEFGFVNAENPLTDP